MYLEQDDQPQPDQQQPPVVEESFQETGTLSRPKRNSGRTGPTSPAGVSRSAQNSFQHGGCSQTLIIEGESEEAWLLLHDRWCATYNTSQDENTLLYDFTRKTAQAEWFRIRCQRNYDHYVISLGARSPLNWTPEEFKKHDLIFRYKNAAERSYHRELRALEQHCKLHPKAENNNKTEKQPDAEPEKIDHGPGLNIVAADPDSPTGYVMVCEVKNGRKTFENNGRPFTPPDPLPNDWPKFYLPKKAEKPVD